MQKNEKSEKFDNIAKKLGYDNSMSALKLSKIIINMGVGRYKDDKTFLESAKKDIALITGQKPAARPAKKSISGFKLRQGEVVGFTATLRGQRMKAFYEKLIGAVLPRLRDFRGVSAKSFDNGGSYTLGLSDHSVFPEIDANKLDKIKNIQITIVTTAKDKKNSYEFLKARGFPFRD